MLDLTKEIDMNERLKTDGPLLGYCKPEEIKTAPWLKCYGEVPFHLDYPDYSIVSAVMEAAKGNPAQTAISFQGKATSFKELVEQIKQTAAAFTKMGIKEGDFVTICMPNTPQAILCLYAVNYIGAVASMIHPLSAVKEIEFYIKETKSRTIITIDQFYWKIVQARQNTNLDHIIIASISEALPFVKKTAYRLIKERKFQPKVVEDGCVIKWRNFFNSGKDCGDAPFRDKRGKDLAVILFSGGTTGVSKGIMLSNLNFNSCAMQTATMCNTEVHGAKMLAAMPIFHGFGLGVCIHTILIMGGESILVPQVSVKGYSQLLKTEQPNYIAGVPTLYEGITRNKEMDKVSLACLRGVFSGGDSLPVELKKKIDKFLADHGAKVKVREGYGLTESVTANCLTPYLKEKEGSIGLPFPDTYYTIVKPGTTEEVPYGTEGEICLRGPSVMLGYLNHPDETANTLKKHADGYTWLHTGDVGKMDDEGFVFFTQRIKRMIITSGYNVYPSQVEKIINELEEVQMSCIIGVPDSYKIHKIKAFVVLADGFTESEEIRNKIMMHLKHNVARYAMPYEIEFRSSLPKTLVGKIAYRELENEEEKKLSAQQSNR